MGLGLLVAKLGHGCLLQESCLNLDGVVFGCCADCLGWRRCVPPEEARKLLLPVCSQEPACMYRCTTARACAT